MSSANSTPQLLSFSPQTPSESSWVLGESGGRIWLWTDTGTGLQLHYLTEDGTGAVPLQLPNGITSNAWAGGFVEYGDNVVFWVYDYDDPADELNGWMYAVKFDDPKQPDPDPKALQTELSANGSAYPERPGLIARPHETVTLRCEATNNSDSIIRNVGITIVSGKGFADKYDRTVGKSRRRKGSRCRIDAIASGETRSCTVQIRVRPGTRRYTCTSRSSHAGAVKKISRSSDSVWITGRRGKKS